MRSRMSPNYGCKICHKTNRLSNMRIGTLEIHLKGPSHEANAKKIKNSLGAQRHEQILIH